MKIRNYFLIAVGGALLGAASGFAWRALDRDAERDDANPVQTVEQVDSLPAFSYPDLRIMHPGPVNRGVELASEVVDSDRAVILNQVTNGVAVRMAVLYLLAGEVDRGATD